MSFGRLCAGSISALQVRINEQRGNEILGHFSASGSRQMDFKASRETSTRTPAPSVNARSSTCRGPKRKRSLANGQRSVRLNIVSDGKEDPCERRDLAGGKP